MFRQKRGLRSHILWPVIGVLVVAGLIWFMPWSALSSVVVGDTPEIEASKDEPEEASTEDQPEQAATEDHPEQEEIAEDPPKDEEVSVDTPSPPQEQGSSNNLLSPSPLPAQPSLPSPPPPSPLIEEEVPENFLPPDDYWYYEPGYSYYEPDYWYYDPSY
jgi:hypothetical protein